MVDLELGSVALVSVALVLVLVVLALVLALVLAVLVVLAVLEVLEAHSCNRHLPRICGPNWCCNNHHVHHWDTYHSHSMVPIY